MDFLGCGVVSYVNRCSFLRTAFTCILAHYNTFVRILAHFLRAAFYNSLHLDAFSTPFVCILYSCILRSRAVCILMHSPTCCILDMMHYDAF